MKDKILKLRKNGKSYNEIVNELGCKKSLVSYHCRNNGLGGEIFETLDGETIELINEYYKTHTVSDCVKEFNLSKSTIIKYTINKRSVLSEKEKLVKNYERVKNHRQKLKEKAVEYKGGYCEKCGYSKCNGALEFHHKDASEKDFTISKYSTISWDKIKVELDKCILVCSNCHKEIHHEEYLLNVSIRFV